MPLRLSWKLKRHKSPGTDQIPAELIKAGGKTVHFEIHKCINSIWNKVELPEQWKELNHCTIYKKGNKTDCSNYRSISLFVNRIQNFIQHPAAKVNLHMQRKFLGNINVDFDITGQLLIIYSAFVKHYRKNGNTMRQGITSCITFSKSLVSP